MEGSVLNEVMISYSDDFGRTWSAEEWYETESAGAYQKRVVLYRQGAAYGRIYRVKHTENASFTIISGRANFSIGT